MSDLESRLMREDRSQRRLASKLIDHVADVTESNVLTYTVGEEAEGGYEIQAYRLSDGFAVTVRSDKLMDAAVALAQQLGVELEDG